VQLVFRNWLWCRNRTTYVTFSTDLQAIILIRNSGLLGYDSVLSDQRHLEGSKCLQNVGNHSPDTSRARSLRPRCFRVVDPETTTPIYIYNLHPTHHHIQEDLNPQHTTLRTSNCTYIYILSHSQAQWSTVWTHLHYTVGRIGLCFVCVHMYLQWNLNPPFLKGPWTANNKCRRMTIVRKALNVSK
jgi:hypothetical protein